MLRAAQLVAGEVGKFGEVLCAEVGQFVLLPVRELGGVAGKLLDLDGAGSGVDVLAGSANALKNSASSEAMSAFLGAL